MDEGDYCCSEMRVTAFRWTEKCFLFLFQEEHSEQTFTGPICNKVRRGRPATILGVFPTDNLHAGRPLQTQKPVKPPSSA